MKSFVLSLIFIMVMVAVSFGQAITSGITDGLTASTFFDMKSNDIAYGGILSLVSYKNYVGIDVGLVTANVQNIIGVGGIGLNLGKILKSVGFDVHTILEQARVGAFAGKYLKDSMQLDMYGLYIGTYIQWGGN